MGSDPAPIDAVVAITYRCNSKCVMCNIWQDQRPGVMTPEDYNVLPPGLRYVNISGGEPFLRKDLVDIYRVIRTRCPSADIVINSNGYCGDAMLGAMKKILEIDPKVGLGLSVDGLEEVHDKIRGIPGGFRKILKILEGVKALGMTNLRFAFTATGENDSHLSRVYHLSQELGIQFTAAVAHDSGHYFQVQGARKLHDGVLATGLREVMVQELQSTSPKRWARAFFAFGLYQFSQGQPRPIRCKAGSSFFFLDPLGELYPCNILDDSIGNVKKDGWDAVWSSERAGQIRAKVGDCQVNCWMVCTARTSMMEKPMRVIRWILGNKLRAHLSPAGLLEGH